MDNVPTAQRITLRNFKIAKFASHETTCFEANIYFDGKFLGTAENSGQGGPTNIHCGNDERLRMCEAEAWAKTLPPDVTDLEDPTDPTGKFVIAMDMEHLIDKLVWEAEEAASLKRLMRTKVLFIKGGKVWNMSIKGRKADPIMIAACQKNHPGCPILNEMPIDRALRLFNEASA